MREIIMRRVASIFVGLIGLLFLVVTLGIGSMLPAQIERDRAYYRNFESTAAYLAAYSDEQGKLEHEAASKRLAERARTGGVDIWLAGPEGCGDFKAAQSDSFVLEAWRGEWFECYAHPSGRSTLAISVWEIVIGWGLQLLLLAAVSVAGFWGMRRLWSQPRSARKLSV